MSEFADPEMIALLWEAATPEEREELRRLLDHRPRSAATAEEAR